MAFKLLEVDYCKGAWFWITILSIEFGDQCRSLLHVENQNSVWKLQILWINNNCWLLE